MRRCTLTSLGHLRIRPFGRAAAMLGAVIERKALNVSLLTNASDYSSETTIFVRYKHSFNASLIGVVTGVGEQRYVCTFSAFIFGPARERPKCDVACNGLSRVTWSPLLYSRWRTTTLTGGVSGCSLVRRTWSRRDASLSRTEVSQSSRDH